MIDVKKAIASAKAYAAEILGNAGFLLEEVRSFGDHFEITLSMPDRGIRIDNPLLAGRREPREYKTFNVSKDSGEVTGMTIRQIA